MKERTGVCRGYNSSAGAIISVKRRKIDKVEEFFPGRAGSGTVTQTLRLELAVGAIEIEARLPGYLQRWQR